ncbi:MAG TPA: HoxN/HupN/NixA family nickel/cobalt transporter [Thermoplasmata archaeon]|nr:HoxN/HupN/NixA family nickel/cobalt transporter [Thermoplasmata archaeon]
MDRSRPLGPGDLALTSEERLFVVFLYVVLIGVTFAAFAAAFEFLPHHYSSEVTGGGLIFSGIAITAYVLGLRHGFDADHIAAIDNTTRKLLNEGRRPLTVGTWFSLGHSTIVVAMVGLLVIALNFIDRTYNTFAAVGATLGTIISGVFLVIIGLVNLVIVGEVYRMFRGLRTGELDSAALEHQMQQRGFLYRYFGKLFRVVEQPWQIYPIGVLFGLGFDTATEIILIGISVTFAATGAFPLWAVMLLPLLFTCGMMLSDTTDGIAMRYAYGWAFNKPIRKVFYNLTLTVISVLVAFAIGGVEFLQVISYRLGWQGAFWNWIGNLDFESLGVGIVLLFVGSWAVALVLYRWKRYEEVGFRPAVRGEAEERISSGP